MLSYTQVATSIGKAMVGEGVAMLSLVIVAGSQGGKGGQVAWVQGPSIFEERRKDVYSISIYSKSVAFKNVLEVEPSLTKEILHRIPNV